MENTAGTMEEEAKETSVLMWGYLPGASPSPLLSPVTIRLPLAGDSLKDVCGGGCGFAVAIAESGKLITWGSADDQGQSYLTSGKHGEIPEPFPLPTEAPIVKAAAGWSHCVSVTDAGDVYTWGWKECVPSVKVFPNFGAGGSLEHDTFGKQSSIPTEEAVSPQSQDSKINGAVVIQPEKRKAGEEMTKRRRTSVSAKQQLDSSVSTCETLSAPPCRVALDPGVRITSVAAGGRHTLVLSDVGQVWGWGYGGEGQLGLGSRVKMVSSPHLIPCIEPSSCGKDRSSEAHRGSRSSAGNKIPGSYIKGIACGGRHSTVITDVGAVLAFGWGLYGQCGQGNTNDVLRPTCVSSLLGNQIQGIAAGLWHTVCISVEGRVHAFGGNQFGQLGFGTSSDDAETLPRLLDGELLESKHAKLVSCGARHSAILTEDGQLYSWGWNKYGQLGLGDTVDRNVPSQVPIEGFRAKSVACGWWHTLLLAETPP